MHKAARLIGPALFRSSRCSRVAHASLSSLGSGEATNVKKDDPANFNFGLKEEFAFRTGQEKGRKVSTVDTNETGKFRSMAAEWWDTDGECKPLHSMNQLRVGLVVNGLVASGKISPEKSLSPKPLEGIRVVDVGCGGGILCEPLARLGANVTGLEPLDESRDVAEQHAKKHAEEEVAGGRIRYLPTPVEEFTKQEGGSFDAVILSEVIEHVSEQRLFVRSCGNLAKPGGSIFATTINRTRESYLFGVLAAECLLGLLPNGTHDWQKFVTPEEFQSMLKEEGGCQVRLIHGMFYWPVFNTWSWIPQVNINYALHALKN